MSRSSSIKSGLASSADGSPARDWGDGGDADFTDEEDDDVPDWMGVDEERTDDHTPRRQRLMSEAFVIPVQSVNEPEPEPVIEKTRWHTTVTSPNPRSPNSSDFLSLPTTPEQPQHSEETAHEAPLPSTSRAPHSPGRKHKEPKELPPVRQKSTRRPAGLGVPTGVEEGGLYPDGGRSMLRPRETNPLSASDFSDFYGTFEHAPSAYDSEPPAQHHPSAIPTLPDVVELASPPLPPIPSPGADSEVSSLKTTVAVDRRRQIAAGEDDPTYSASFSDMSNDLFHDADSTRAESTRGGGGELAVEEAPEPPSGTGTPRGDAKARAAAFVADLKRAKLQAAAAAAAAAASTQPEPVQASPTIPSPIVYPSSPALPQVPQEPAVPPRNTSPLPPTPSHEPTRTISPLPPPPSHGVASPEQLSPSESPDVEVLANVKTPASNETYTVPTPRPSLSPSLSGLSTQTASTQSFAPSHSNSVMDLDKLTGARYRPLPDCLRTTDVRKARTPAERAKLYAVKINALARENSGTEAWIGFVKASHTPPGTNGPFPGAPGFASPNTSPGRSRHSRDDGSSASFPARNDGTGYRAREISYGSFVPKDLTPNTPFPGVLHLGRGGKPTPLAKSSFFSLGRKASSSKRLPPSASSMRSPGLSPLSFNGNVSSGRAMGPRMPGAPRASFDSGSSGPFSPPLGGSALPQQPQRASFSYHGPTSTPPIAEVDPQMLQKLIDVLPHGDRQTLASCLARSGNDEVSAISLFLSEEAERRQ
ncbi:hypothetical protein MNV49_007018 [Pseudohyphozyma bogoriensis]|nr:hypothetical protein MNV49_007018 [Pseudohyphozyma bogoriensis]